MPISAQYRNARKLDDVRFCLGTSLPPCSPSNPVGEALVVAFVFPRLRVRRRSATIGIRVSPNRSASPYATTGISPADHRQHTPPSSQVKPFERQCAEKNSFGEARRTATACQHAIPAVVQGRYEILVVSNTEVRGCGVHGAELLLWTFVNGAYFSSSQTLPWPGSGATVTFDAAFSSGSPEGVSEPVTEFKGHLFDREGRPLLSGTVVEAYVGDVRCGLTSLRYGDEVERFDTLIVAGPEAISGCAEGATLTFRLNGELAAETAVNDLGRGSQAHELNLTVQ